MRKHPLIALTAFTALTASAIAGASTGTFESSSALTSARTHQQPGVSAAPSTITYGADLAYQLSPPGRDLSVVHDPGRPARIELSSITGLPVARRHVLRARPTVLATVSETPVQPVVVAPVVTTAAPPAAAPAGGVWYELRMCESGGNYAEDTGNGFYGAYQFSLSTWYGLGFTGLPSDASPAVQDRAAEELEAEAGWGQWPGCSEELGL